MRESEPLWEPDAQWKEQANFTRFVDWYFGGSGRDVADYSEAWDWSVGNIERFWEVIWKRYQVISHEPYKNVLSQREMPGAKWFEGATLNYAEHALRNSELQTPAIIHLDEEGNKGEIGWGELKKQTAAIASSLRALGVKKGDRVAAYISNVPEAVVSLLASASIGAVWSSCSPDFGAPSVRDRFRQIEPKVLIASTGYRYDGKYFERGEAIREIVNSLPSVTKTILVGNTVGLSDGKWTQPWDDMISRTGKLEFEQVPFDHPLWILYSSGTTGLPKPIVHGHGGILLEHLKVLSLHNDLKPSDRFFWFTTTGWMMWNYLIGGLLLGSTVVLYDGSPSYPDAGSLWTLAEKNDVSFLGTSAAHLTACMKSGIDPMTTHGLHRLRGVGSTGSPLSPEAFRWVYSNVKSDVWLASLSGGTDVCTAFVGGCPVLPVYPGEIQCRCLGAKVESYNEKGEPVVGEVGELVLTEPMPSMPLFLWGDGDGKRYRQSYFEPYPGVWRHGDWVEITSRGTCLIYGRSDATIKRMGVRIGTSELYRVVESMPEVADCLAIDLDVQGGATQMLLFVVIPGDRDLDESLAGKIKAKVRADLSPRYVPDKVVQVPSIPKTLNGKKLEVPVKRIFMGADPAKTVIPGSLADPGSLEFYVKLAKRMGVGGKV